MIDSYSVGDIVYIVIHKSKKTKDNISYNFFEPQKKTVTAVFSELAEIKLDNTWYNFEAVLDNEAEAKELAKEQNIKELKQIEHYRQKSKNLSNLD